MAIRCFLSRLTLVLAAALLLLAAQERAGPAFAAEFTVTWGATDAVDTNPGDGVCDDGAGNCPLRAAIMEANALPGHDTIDQAGINAVLSIPGAGEDASATGDLDVTDDLTIDGGAAGFIIRGMNSDRVLHVIGSDTELTLEVGDIQSGNAGAEDGGGILSEGPLVLKGTVVEHNAATRGGGIAALSDLTIANIANQVLSANSAIENNTASGNGGGIYVAGTLTTDGVSITGNSAAGTADGGGIYNDGGSVVLSDSTISENSAGSGGGGGVYNAAGTLELSLSSVSANEAVDGAGVYNAAGATVTSRWSSIDGNTIAMDLFSGGGVFNEGTAEITDSTISGNRNGIGAGIYNIGSISLTNVTISGNVANDIGGGLNNQGDATLTNVTMSSNNATDGSVIWSDGSATVVNSILEAFPPDDIRPCQGITSLGHNISNRLACSLAGPGDILLDRGQLLLGPLADNEWVTQTHALLAGSPAIDAADDAVCPATDQRLVARPQDGDGDGESRCDIGAYELRAPSPTPTPTPAQLPETGGTPASSGGGPWLALLVAGVALVGAGGALAAARRRR